MACTFSAPIRFALTAFLVALCCSGCTLVSVPLGDPLAETRPEAAETPDAQPAATFTVELRPASEQAERVEVPLEDVTYLQDALVKTGAMKEFRRRRIELYRPVGPDGRYLKIDIPFDRSKHRIPHEYDYAVRPGDRIVVIEDTSNVLDDMLSSVAGPLGNLAPFQR